MMRLLQIAFRNILRNRRRSLMTGSAVAAGAAAMLLFGGFAAYIFAGLETNNVQRVGHLTIFRSGYFLFGSGNPAAYGIDRYQSVIDLVRKDPVLQPMIRVVTPTQTLLGIAGNFSGEADASKTFMGVGLIPSDRERMRQWDEFGVSARYVGDARLSDQDPERGLLGVGIARILGLCAPLSLPNCAGAPRAAEVKKPVSVRQDIADLAARSIERGGDKQAMPQINLLAATAGGAPNVVVLSVRGAESQAAKELDDNYVAMHLALAQQLVYGRGEHKATGIVLQLHRSEDMPAARARLTTVLQQNNLPLEVRDFAEQVPFYTQVVALFSSIFFFIALVMGVIVLFAVVNTMTMNVMERTNEIGTIRAMGVRRASIRWQFIAEGALIGAVGASIGAVLAIAIALLINRAGLTWMPPGSAAPSPLRLEVLSHPRLILSTWLVLAVMATIAALLPAGRAARLSVVDALRHV
ncbi:ABC transporter permease [Roseiterribacter gracilis]|uniref:Permease n=1 Tax=Roseiterribacter gracilis TaxID=2812848 RepID=A0A8S8XKR1_9PROT|nr:permease [Rhodospirillales bacterium TMPK1]